MKWRYIVGILALTAMIACLLLSAIGWSVLLSSPGVMKDDADRIAVGMTLEQVTEILRRQSDNSGKTINIGGAPTGVGHVWNVDDRAGNRVGTLTMIVNDADSKVTQKSFNPGGGIIPNHWR